MDKASKTGIVMRHEPTGLYFSKNTSLTENLFNAMVFPDEENAAWYINESFYRPADPHNYKAYQLVTTKEVIEHEPTDLYTGMDGRTQTADETGRSL